MEAAVCEQPVAGFVCEYPRRVLVAERRAANRAPEGWHEDGRVVKRYYHGHLMRLEPLSAEGRMLGWFMWMDDSYRGVEGRLAVAEHLLEIEVEHAIRAWERKQAWIAMGSPERRRGRC